MKKILLILGLLLFVGYVFSGFWGPNATTVRTILASDFDSMDFNTTDLNVTILEKTKSDLNVLLKISHFIYIENSDGNFDEVEVKKDFVFNRVREGECWDMNLTAMQCGEYIETELTKEVNDYLKYVKMDADIMKTTSFWDLISNDNIDIVSTDLNGQVVVEDANLTVANLCDGNSALTGNNDCVTLTGFDLQSAVSGEPYYAGGNLVLSSSPDTNTFHFNDANFLSTTHTWTADQNFNSVKISTFDLNVGNSIFNNGINYSFADLNGNAGNYCDANQALTGSFTCIDLTGFHIQGAGSSDVNNTDVTLSHIDVTNDINISGDLNFTDSSGNPTGSWDNDANRICLGSSCEVSFDWNGSALIIKVR